MEKTPIFEIPLCFLICHLGRDGKDEEKSAFIKYQFVNGIFPVPVSDLLAVF